MAGIHHDRVEGNALFSEAQGELEMFWVGGMVKMYRNRDRGRVGAKVRSIKEIKKYKEISQLKAISQEGAFSVGECDRE